jgi:hypothetical protein
MPKEFVYPIADLGLAIGDLAGEKARAMVMEGSERIADLSLQEASAWLKGAIAHLDAGVDEPTRVEIMERLGLNCAEMNKSHVEQALARRNRFASLDEFLQAEEKTPSPGTRLIREGDVVYQYYDPLAAFHRRCFCGLWWGLPDEENAPLTWCQCSRAFVAKVWEGYAGRPVKVELIESCISGAKQCKFAIHL